MVCFEWVFRVEVVLLKIRIDGFFSSVCVMVMCCFLLFESFRLCLLIMVW